LRRATRVLRSNLRCFFLAIRLRRFLMTEPMKSDLLQWCAADQRGGFQNAGESFRPPAGRLPDPGHPTGRTNG
jgi:hypothetical protein